MLFSQYVEQTVTDRLDVSAGITGDVALEDSGFGAAVDNAISYVSSSQSTERTLLFALKVRTATQGFSNPPNYPVDGSACEQQGFGSVEQFLRACGNKYLQKRDLGGIVLIAVNFETLSEEQKAEARRNESVDVYGVELGIEAGLTSIQEAVGTEQSVYVWSSGFTLPGEAIAEGASETTMNALINWAGELDKDDGTLILDQHFIPYSSTVLNSCGIGSEIVADYRCASRFFAEARELDSDDVLYRRILYLQEVANSPNDFSFKEPSTIDDVTDFLQMRNDCDVAVANAESTCRDAVENGEVEAFCSVCTIPEVDVDGEERSCAGTSLQAIANELFWDIRPKATPVSPSGPAASLTLSEDDVAGGQQTLPRNSELCTFSGMKGDFAGGGERVSIVPDVTAQGASPTTPSYVVTVDSGHPSDDGDAKLTGFFHCSPYSEFFYNNDPAAPDFEDWQAFLLTNSVQTPLPPIRVGALSGLSGEMAGGAEFGIVKSSIDKAEADSNQGSMDGWFSFFGPKTSNNQDTLYAADADSLTAWQVASAPGSNSGSMKLPSSEDAHCFLTELRGEFDGHEEWVKLEVDNNGFYKLRYSAHAPWAEETKKVQATARCIAFDQT